MKKEALVVLSTSISELVACRLALGEVISWLILPSALDCPHLVTELLILRFAISEG
jgi:hypothetical protein